MRELVTKDKNLVNDEDDSSNTALHLAALAGHAKLAEVLLEFGADVAARYDVHSVFRISAARCSSWVSYF